MSADQCGSDAVGSVRCGRFCVIATVLLRATARAVCLAFVEAMRTHGVPSEVLHVLAGGHRIKTLPSRLDHRDLARLTAAGATSAGPPPLPRPPGA